MVNQQSLVKISKVRDTKPMCRLTKRLVAVAVVAVLLRPASDLLMLLEHCWYKLLAVILLQ